jgi:hypothetical protein
MNKLMHLSVIHGDVNQFCLGDVNLLTTSVV